MVYYDVVTRVSSAAQFNVKEDAAIVLGAGLKLLISRT